MWWRSTHAAVGRLLRWVAVAAAAALTAGCFQPLYGEHTAGPGAVAPNIRDAFATVEVDQISAPNGTPEARIAVELRNNVIYELTGGAGSGTTSYRLGVRMKLSKAAMIVDIATGRTEAEIVGIDVYYTLTEVGTQKVVVNSPTSGRVSSAARDPARPIALLFGPDAGLVSERADAIMRAAVDDPNDPFALVRLDGDELAGDPSRLIDEANTVPLFGGRRAIRVKAGGRDFSSAL